MQNIFAPKQEEGLVAICTGKVALEGNLDIPDGARGIVVFAHGSGSSRNSPRNRYVAETLQQAGLATLLFDLLTPSEEEVDRLTRHLRFDIDLLAERLVGATNWLQTYPDTAALNIGYFGASTGSAAALIAAAELPQVIRAVVSRGGRPDLAISALPSVAAPTLLIVGGNDKPVLELNRDALLTLKVEKRLEIVHGATHLFEEPGALGQVSHLASQWFKRHLNSDS
ncbi:MAG: dienelactone hydrolase family protein [Synechococcus sp.]